MSVLQTFSREDSLRERLNAFLCETFDFPVRDYYSTLDAEAILGLKSALADINNILTLKVTMAFVDWLCERLGLDASIRCEWRSSLPSRTPMDLTSPSDHLRLWLVK